MTAGVGAARAGSFFDAVSHFGVGPRGRPGKESHYRALFESVDDSWLADEWVEPDVFAWLRVAGPNARMLEPVSQLPQEFALMDEAVAAAGGAGLTVQQAIDEGRLFACDYRELRGLLTPGAYTDHKTGTAMSKHIGGVYAVFVTNPEGKPARRRLGGTTERRWSPPPTATGGLSPPSSPTWPMPPTTSSSPTSAGPHLYVEPVLLATRRELPAGHRIATLLVPHFWIAGQGWLRRRGRLPGRPLVRPHRLRWRGVRQVHALGRRRVRRQTLP